MELATHSHQVTPDGGVCSLVYCNGHVQRPAGRVGSDHIDVLSVTQDGDGPWED